MPIDRINSERQIGICNKSCDCNIHHLYIIWLWHRHADIRWSIKDCCMQLFLAVIRIYIYSVIKYFTCLFFNLFRSTNETIVEKQMNSRGQKKDLSS